VIAPSSGEVGNPQRIEQKQTFKEDGWRFLEVKIMTSPADGYAIVFRKKA
jgi:hypothetical protein